MSVVRRGGRLVGIFVGMILVFVLAMTLVYALPQHRIVKDLRASLPLLNSEGLRPYVLLQHRAYRLDNFTDALMLDTAIRTQPGGPLYNAMGDFKQVASVGATSNPILALQKSSSGHRDNPADYAYYWHGYQVLLRPALVVFTYAEIRYVNLLLFSSLGLAVLLMLAWRAGSRAAVAFGLAAATCGFALVPMSLQFSSMSYLMLCATLVVLINSQSDWLRRNDVEFFLVVGMLAAFFDLLTTPLMTLGMPLAVALVLATREKREHPWKSDLLFIVRAGVAWAVGYAGAWVTKWFVGTAVLGINVVHKALVELLRRSGASTGTPIVSAITRNLSDLVPMLTPKSVASTVELLGLVVIVLLALFLAFRAPLSRIRRVLPVLLVVPLPYLWYAAASNHSSVHDWYTYRAQVFAVFALIYVISCAIDFEAIGRKLGWLSEVAPPDEA